MSSKMEEREVTLADPTVETSQYVRYKGTKGRTDRVAIISCKLIRAFRYYSETSKKSFRAPESAEMLEKCRAELGEPEQRFGLVLFHYTTTEDGALLDDSKCQGKIKVWSISEARYEELSALHRSWPLLDSGWEGKQVDLQIKCTEEQYQRMVFTPMPEAHWKKKEKWFKALKEREAKAQVRVQQALGWKLTDAEIMATLGMSSVADATGSLANTGDVDLSDVLDD